MPLMPIQSMIKNAVAAKYAIGYFESWSIDSLQGVIDAAEETRSPIIIGFNGEFMSHPKRTAQERLSWYGALGQAAAESATVPCGLIFNECNQADWVLQSIDCGFNLVMPIDEAGDLESYLATVKKVVQKAHPKGIAVEVELDELPEGDSDNDSHHTSMTDPSRAARFMKESGADLLAVSVGNVHISTSKTQELDIDLLKKIAGETDVPLVLHGGSGIGADSIKEAVAVGVVKVNYGTYLKQRYLQAMRESVALDVDDPHVLLGKGGVEDVWVRGRQAIKDAVLERIERLGCCGKAYTDGVIDGC